MYKGKIKKGNLSGLIRLFILALVFTVCPVFSSGTAFAGSDISLNKTTVNVGETIKINTKKGKYKFSSSDYSVVHVDSNGVITGKSVGKGIIKAKAPGKEEKTFEVNVKRKKNMPRRLPVCINEVKLSNMKMVSDREGFDFSARIKNNSRNGKIYKVEFYYNITQAGYPDTATGTSISQGAVSCLTAKNINSKGISKAVKCRGDISGDIENMELVKIKLYSLNALQIYDAKEDSYSIEWGYDRSKPKIYGMVGEKSYSSQDVYQVFYSDRKDSSDFTRFVKAVDNKDGKLKVSADTGKIDWKKPGIYKIYYTAVDKAGNKAKAWARVRVVVKGGPEEIADTVLARIIKDGWSDTEKARAIYNYVCNNVSYIENGRRGDWRNEGASSLSFRSGDCYSYYCASRLLLSRAGIPNIMVRRYPESPGNNHWWNLVYVQGGWYHFDTTPRLRRGYFCLMTDAQMHLYSAYTFSFIDRLYPPRAKKAISRNPV